MDSCFVLVKTHQHGIASTVSLLPPLIDSTAMTCWCALIRAKQLSMAVTAGSPAKNVYAGPSTHVLQKWHVIYFGQCHWLRGKNAREVLLRWKKRWQLFLAVAAVAISCHCKRSKIILVKVLTEVCCLENIASWNRRKIVLAWSDSVLLVLRSLVCTWKTCRKGG